MSGFNLNEWINRPIQLVFDALTSPDRAPEIMSNIKQMEQISEGQMGVGTRFRETRLVNGKEETTELEVVVYEPPFQYGVVAEAAGIEVTYSYHLSNQNGGTEVDLTCDVTTKGLKKLILPVVAQIMKKEDGGHLAELKKALEK